MIGTEQALGITPVADRFLQAKSKYDDTYLSHPGNDL